LIRDDGRGFDARRVLGDTALSSGLGLPAMRERVRMLGGAINIRSRRGSGTRIVFTIPAERK
jgi:signal transduction histidine kinase